jgi:hypothetical protein
MGAILFGFALAAIVARFVRWRRTLARLERHLRQLRDLVMRPMQYRRIDEQGADVAELDQLNDVLRANELTVLGDAFEVLAGKRATRWFVDPAGTTFGWLGFVTTRAGMRPIVALISHGAERAVFTLCSPVGAPGLAQPPFVDRVVVAGPLKLGDALTRHRGRVPVDAQSAATLDDATAAVQRLRAQTITWRDAQAPTELLDQDLRALLGKHYPRLGPAMTRRLAPEIPVARVNV